MTTKKAGRTRLYTVKIADLELLVRAKSPNAAARYAIASLGTSVALAGQEDIARIIKAGGDIVDAPVDSQEELPLE